MRLGHHDPGAEPEDEGIPDLEDGSPGARRAEAPQRMPVPGEAPVAAESFGVTGAEQAAGQSLDERLAAEEPEIDAVGAAGTPDPAGLGPEERAVRTRRVEQVDLLPQG
ncbi:hypothetical protein BX265_7846 [Streptomyces sp. TLI_235]|nr:hypothetical protein BX265_7846 [Streptomyces sp. TLI_235]